MKNINKYKILAGVCLMSMMASCDYEEINTNAFEMTEEEGIRDGFAVGGLITSMEKAVVPVGTQADDTDMINEYQTSYHLSADNWSGFFSENNSWGNGQNNTSYFLKDAWVSSTYKWSYTQLLDSWKKLKASAEANGTPEVYALAQILKISAWHKALETFGPMPYSHAADASLSIPFDSEKDVYTAIFKDLTEAIAVLTPLADNGVKVMSRYDAVYEGDLKKWVKYANSLMLRLAIHIRFADSDMAKTYAGQAKNHTIGLITAADEAAKMGTGAGLVFRNNIEWLSEQYNEARMGSSMYSYLVGYKDPRLSAYFKPASDPSIGEPAYDGQVYQAVPAGHTYGQNQVYTTCSKPNIQSQTPTYWLRASEVSFLLAEAALAWGAEFGDPETLYKQGIAMSFSENNVSSSVDSYISSGNKPTGHKMNGQYPCDYPAPCSTTAEFSGNDEEKLEKIMIQKWIALYPNGQEAWTEWRRTGYPKLNPVMVNMGEFQGADKKNGVRRMIYPSSFYSSTEGKAVYDAALQLFNNGAGGADKSSTRLWFDCKR